MKDSVSKAIIEYAITHDMQCGFYVHTPLTKSQITDIQNSGFLLSEPTPTDSHCGYCYSITS